MGKKAYFCNLFQQWNYNKIMKEVFWEKIRKYMPVIFLVSLALISSYVFADVGNMNRYSDVGGSVGGDGDTGWILAFLMLFRDHPLLAIIILIVVVVVSARKKGESGSAQNTANPVLQQQHDALDRLHAAQSASHVAVIQQIDPDFSADKFCAWAREVFMKIQEAWTSRNWKTIRPFESEELFSQHSTQLEEYIRNNKINVVEKIAIRSCSITDFRIDGDKEVVSVYLRAVMRDYVIDAITRKVLESDPNRDWDMAYEMVFIRKAGVKTAAGHSNMSTTNCPNCGAPTSITSAGQCEYCGSIITTGAHDWVLTDIHSAD